MDRVRMAADLGAHVDRGKKGTEGMDKDIVIDRGSEGSDVGGCIVGNVAMQQDEVEKVLVYEFFLGVPKLLVILVNNGVLVWVAVVSGSADGGREEVREKISGSRI